MSGTDAPVVSVVMAVRNGAATLGAALESILGQSFLDLECILIDDGSDDGSAEIVRSYGDSRIRLVSNAERQGLARSLNKGFTMARGRYLARMDADDVSRQDRFERQLREFASDPSLGVVGSNVILVSGSERKLWGLPASSSEICARLVFANALSHPSVMLKREVLRGDERPYDEQFEFAQDYALWTRLALSVAFKNIQEPLVDYRYDGPTPEKSHGQHVLSRKIRLRYLVDLGVSEKAIDAARHHDLAEGRSPRTLLGALRLVRWGGRLVRLLGGAGWACVPALREEVRWRLRDAGRGCESRRLRRVARLARRGFRVA